MVFGQVAAKNSSTFWKTLLRVTLTNLRFGCSLASVFSWQLDYLTIGSCHNNNKMLEGLTFKRNWIKKFQKIIYSTLITWLKNISARSALKGAAKLSFCRANIYRCVSNALVAWGIKTEIGIVRAAVLIAVKNLMTW